MFQLIRCDASSYHVVLDGENIGSICVSENPFHRENRYVQLQLETLDEGLSMVLFDALQEQVDRKLQVMCASTDIALIRFLEKGGFRCRRKCYERTFSREQLKERTDAFFSMEEFAYPDTDYMEACRILYGQYQEKHREINPLTAELDAFIKLLPASVWAEKREQKITNFAFVEENEIAYVGSNQRDAYPDFIRSVVNRLFREYETICFECDDTDWEATQLALLFQDENDASYDTYIREERLEEEKNM